MQLTNDHNNVFHTNVEQADLPLVRQSSDTSSDADSDTDTATAATTRRQFLSSSIVILGSAFTTPLLLHPALPAQGRGLVQFPSINSETGANTLMNTYHLMRAGTSLLEEQGIWSTNPLFLTNREDALSPLGYEQVRAACQVIRRSNLLPSLIKYSLAASCMDTANVLGQELSLGRDRLVPEYTFLDPRAIGSWDMSRRSLTEPAILALDVDRAGPDGMVSASRPPPNEDGTPHEVLADQAVRLRQLVSLLESQDAGETIVLVFPDGTGPAVLSCLMAGIPLNRVHELEFTEPGEVRLNVTYHTVRALWNERLNDPVFMKQYNDMLQQGRATLQQLSSSSGSSTGEQGDVKTTSGVDIVNIRDQQIEQERIEIEQQMVEIQRQRREAEQRNEELRRQRQQQLAAERHEQQRQRQNGGPPATTTVTAVGAAGVLAAMGGFMASNRDQAATNAASSSSMEAGLDSETNDIGGGGGGGLYGSTVILPSQDPDSLVSGPQIINGDRSSNKIEVIEDPYDRAQRAMEEYLDRDDGGEAWIDTLSQLLQEDDDIIEYVAKSGLCASA